ncbi:neuronal pentraxin-1-like [Carassius auratus]|uniref:Neuronal pentraxin-1-like n=1 Tax=Carassius auratus TaxID=7957 RepID=A0A6P6R6A2_CARAU|nr:neuronal pentraxin-1-like [Carassius auratus]
MHPASSRKSEWLFFFFCAICLSVCAGTGMPGSDYTPHPRFICSPIPADADPGCFPTAGGPSGPGSGHQGGPGGSSSGWWGMSEEAKATILHLRESLVQQKETILDQRETIRELSAKLNLCEGSSHTSPHLAHHTHHTYPSAPDTGHLGLELGHYGDGVGGHHTGEAALSEKHVMGEIPSSSSTPEQMNKMLQSLKQRLDNLQTRNTSSSHSSSLKDLLQRKISALEQQMQHHHPDHEEEEDDREHDSHDDHSDSHDESHHSDPHDNNSHQDNEASEHGSERLSYDLQGLGEAQGGAHSKLDAVLSQLQHRLTDTGSRRITRPTEAFQIGFPMRTNYMYGRVKHTLLHEIFSFTLCLWMKAGIDPGLGTPFSYSVPGQANELVLIEWGNNPMELLVDDTAVSLALSVSDGKWHHVCVTWSARDGLWEAYQDGVKRGSGENLSPWHPIKPGGVFILGQEQDTLGGRFDATQAFVGEISDVQMWSHVLTPHDIYSLASCGGHMTGDIIAWAESEVELHGGVTKYPFDPCH